VLLLIDNYDSFTFNLLHSLESLGESVRVVRNDAISPAEIERNDPEILVISPGPGDPAGAGVSVEAIAASRGRRPILGVCLGHQAIAVAFGGRVGRAPAPIHGKAHAIHHNSRGVFEGIASPMAAARYHSLVIDEATLPPELEVIARGPAGEIMAVAHRALPIVGVQFHPESFLTPEGNRLLRNFLRLARAAAP
jgi:anthranilate synthase/aminodeoxychorismate synthase-like glutamine amidotransferase